MTQTKYFRKINKRIPFLKKIKQTRIPLFKVVVLSAGHLVSRLLQVDGVACLSSHMVLFAPTAKKH